MSASNWICTIDALATATSGRSLSVVHSQFQRVCTDTRAELSGRLFVALKGDQFDGHNFVTQAVEKGAVAVLVHEWREQWKPLLARASFVQVTDTLRGLQDLAHYWRRTHGFKVAGITGSNGKTSTKEFTAELLRPHFNLVASKGSFNNHWGVPLTILEAAPDQRVLILEMGMNKLREIWRLCQIAEPDIVAVTMVGRAHIGELGSQAQIAQAKEEIYAASPTALQIFNVDNEWTIRMQQRSKAKQIRFSSFKKDVDVHFRAQRLNWDGLDLVGHVRGVQGQTWVHVLGRHNTVNLMCAASLALAFGLTPEQIWQGLATLKDVAWGRNQVLQLQNGGRVLFDAYNANPDSMGALMKNLYEMDVHGRKYLLVGDMRELGDQAASAHEELGERAGAVGFEGIWYVGQHSADFIKGLKKSNPPKKFVTSPAADPKISEEFLTGVGGDDLIAVKASRGLELEKIVERWPLQVPLGKKP